MAAAVIVAAGAAGVEYSGGGLTAVALAFALGALACEAAFSLFAVPALERLGALAVSAYACIAAVPLLAVWALAVDGASLPTPTTAEALAFAYLAFGVTTGGFLLWYSSIRLLGVERAGLFSGVLPISALACSAAIGAAEITPVRLLGVAASRGGRDARDAREVNRRHAWRRSRTHSGSDDRADSPARPGWRPSALDPGRFCRPPVRVGGDVMRSATRFRLLSRRILRS